MWLAMNGTLIKNLTNHTDKVNSLVLRYLESETQLISASDDKTIKIWNALSGDLLYSLIGHNDSVVSIDIS
jgi:WD40 repeat protein